MMMSMIVNVCNQFNVDFITPISKVDENFDRAEKMNAAVEGKFWFKVHKNKEYKLNILKESDFQKSDNEDEVESEYRELRLSEIFGGYQSDDGYSFPGLCNLIRKLNDCKEISKENQLKICSYMCYMCQRMKGENMSGAQWIRKFIQDHPSYKKDSLIPEEVMYDLYHSKGINNEWRQYQCCTHDNHPETPIKKPGGLCFTHTICQFHSD